LSYKLQVIDKEQSITVPWAC